MIKAPHIDYIAVLPVMFMLGGALAILAWSSLVRRPIATVWLTTATAMVSAAALVVSLVGWVRVDEHGAHTTIAKSIALDGFSCFISILVTSAVFVVALVIDGWQEREGVDGPEMYVLVLVSAAGAMIMGMANDLLVVFLGLEILSIALYVLTALNVKQAASGEAAMKYFVLGGFSSAVFLFGMALVYGATGSTNLTQIADFLSVRYIIHDGLLLAGISLLLVGFAFKTAAAPFHLWAPDVYEGAPSPITGFMAAVAKAGAFAALLRVFFTSFSVLRDDWRPVIWVLAALSLLVGAVVALVQQNIKRMLAYSSINHAGFILLGLQAATYRGSSSGLSASLMYLFVYSFMVIGSFAVVGAVGGLGDSKHDLDRYRGLARRRPFLAFSLAILLLAQAGIPPLTGFWAKWLVITAAVHAGSTSLAVLAMISAVVAAFFYLRVGVLMFAPLNDAEGGTPPPPVDLAALMATLEASEVSASGEAGDGEGEGEGDSDGESTAAAPASGAASGREPGTEPDAVLVSVGAATTDALSSQSDSGSDRLAATVVAGESGGAPGSFVDQPVATTDIEASEDEEAFEDEIVLDDGASATCRFAIALCVGVTVFFGVAPGFLVDFARAATLVFPH